MSNSDHPFELPSRAWYSASIQEFLAAEPEIILGRLTKNSDFSVIPTQRDAWLVQIRLLKAHLGGLVGAIFLEFSIPRMGRRIDAVLIIGPIVFALEFKVGEAEFDRSGLDQVWDYALDLKNFHEASHTATIVPILIATDARDSILGDFRTDEDGVVRPLAVGPDCLRARLERAVHSYAGLSLDANNWASSPYHPSPTIIEAARALYSQHSVDAIARFDAGARNLSITSRRIEELIDDAKARKRKVIAFVTGVPGAGKTLVGLNIATQRREVTQESHAVFLSGNGPLVRLTSASTSIRSIGS